MIEQDCIKEALTTIETYIEDMTGKAPEPDEIANALTRYFVLKEIHDFIVMERQESLD